jgi:hypothetical protein
MKEAHRHSWNETRMENGESNDSQGPRCAEEHGKSANFNGRVHTCIVVGDLRYPICFISLLDLAESLEGLPVVHILAAGPWSWDRVRVDPQLYIRLVLVVG